MANYEGGTTMYEEGKKSMKKAKFDIVQSYFDGVDENLKDFIIDDDDEYGISFVFCTATAQINRYIYSIYIV
jgi:hypothetical protein